MQQDVLCALACLDPSTAGGFLFGSLDWFDMWFSRSGLPDPAAQNKYLAAGQGLRYWGRHLLSKVEHVQH